MKKPPNQFSIPGTIDPEQKDLLFLESIQPPSPQQFLGNDTFTGWDAEQLSSIANEKQEKSPLPFLTKKEFTTLYDSFCNLGRSGQLEKLANSVRMIRNDLKHQDRETRGMAFSSMQVVIKAMIETNLEKPLTSLLNTMSMDFRPDMEDDMFSLHLDSLMAIMNFFKERNNIPSIVFGLHILANLVSTQPEQRQRILGFNLDNYLDLALLEELLTFQEAPALRTEIDNMFRSRADVLGPILQKGLFQTEDFRLREIIQNFLLKQSAGPLRELLPKELARETPAFMTRHQFEKIQATFTSIVSGENLDMLSRTVTQLKRDMKSPVREKQGLAYSSFQLLVEICLENKQNKILATILNNMSMDFRPDMPQPFFKLHLETLLNIMNYLRELEAWRPFIFGLHVVSNLGMNMEGESLTYTQNKLGQILDTATIRSLVQLDPEDPVFEELNNLLRVRGMVVVRNFLKVLSKAEDPILRNQIKSYLEGLAPKIRAILMEALKQALDGKSELHIKQNLLWLVSKSPSEEFLPILGKLIKDRNAQMRDTALRIIFSMNHKASLPVGRRLLFSAQQETLPRVLDFIAEGKIAFYVDPLIELFQRDGMPVEIKTKIVDTLGRMEAESALPFIRECLARKNIFSKNNSPFRIAAAKALAEHSDYQVRTFLQGFTKDRDPEVRAVARKAMGMG